VTGLDYLGIDLAKAVKGVADVALPVASAVVPGLSVLTSKGDQSQASRDPVQQMMVMQMQQRQEEENRRAREAEETRRMFLYAGLGVVALGGLYLVLKK
jgi:hypothetical protein